MTFSFEKKLILSFAILLTGIVAAGIATFKNNRSAVESDYWVQHTREVLYESGELLSDVQDIVLGARGYIITVDSAFLQPFNNSRSQINENIENLENLVKDNALQQQRIDSVKKLMDKIIQLSVQLIELRNTKGFAEAQQLIASRKGKLYMDEIRSTVHAIQQEENKLLSERQAAQMKATAAYNRSFYFLLGTLIVLLLLVLFTVRHNLQVRKKGEEELKASEEKFRNLIHLSPVGITLSTASGKILEANPEILNMMGFTTKEELMKTPVAEFYVDINDREKRIQLFKKDGYVKNYQSQLKRKDGSLIWVSGHVYPFKLNDSEVAMLSAQMDITGIKKAEEELFVKNDWYNQTLISLGDGVIATDVNGIITLINKAACELTRWTQEDAVGSHVDMLFEISNERTGLKVINPLMEALRENKIVWLANHTILKRKDGSTIFIDDSGAPIHNQKKEIIGGVLIFRDVTEKKKAEEKLKEYQHFFNNSNDLCLIANIEGYFETVNPNLEKVLGYSEKESKETPFIEFVHPDDVAATLHEFEKVASMTGMVMNFMCRFRKKEGSYVWLEWNSIPHPDTGKIYAIGRDITERIKTEEELKVIALKLNEAQALAHVGNWDVNLITGISTWSDETYRILGLNKNEIIPSVELFLSYIHPDDATFVKGIVDGIFRDLKGETFNFRLKRRDGTIVYALSESAIDFDAQKKPLRLFGIIQDVTEIKKAEEQLLAANKELEAFSYSVSHDLRAPLRSIHAYSRILQEDHGYKLDDDGMSSLNAIIKNSKRMGELIDDLLAFSKLGRKEVTTSEVNMSSLIQSIIQEEKTDNPREIDFTIKELLTANADHALIRQVWVNLISNAIKYSKHKPKTIIEIGSYYNENVIVYYIKDNGAGFEMQYYDKLFGVFQRLHSPEEFEGTGIGLAIVKKIVNRHKGTVWAESKVNEGTCFYFTLPK